jgi:hypothetical protein
VDSLKPIPTANRKDPLAQERGGSFLLVRISLSINIAAQPLKDCADS